MENITPVYVNEFPIRLGQFLKLANLVQDGFEAKVRIQYGEVSVNGEVEERRGKKLHLGDLVEFGGTTYRVSSS